MCVVSFDEIKLKAKLTYDSKRDVVEGLQDLGANLSSQSIVADHATVFYVRGLTSSWKQPFAYYLTNVENQGYRFSKFKKLVILIEPHLEVQNRRPL